jgi:ribosomal protein L10
VDGSVMKGDNKVVELSKMPTRVELQGQIVQIALTPGSKLAGAILSQGSAIAGCLKTLIENKEKEAA